MTLGHLDGRRHRCEGFLAALSGKQKHARTPLSCTFLQNNASDSIDIRDTTDPKYSSTLHPFFYVTAMIFNNGPGTSSPIVHAYSDQEGAFLSGSVGQLKKKLKPPFRRFFRRWIG